VRAFSRIMLILLAGAVLPLLWIVSLAAQPIPQNNIPHGWNVSLIGRYAFGPCQAVSVDVAGFRAFFGNGAYFEIADISNPAAPMRVSQVLLPDAVLDIAVTSNYAYIANAGAGVRVIDISRPNQPVEQTVFETLGIASGVAISGTRLLLADGPNGLLVIDLSIPWQPKQMGALDTDGWAKRVVADIHGYYAYVADQHGGLLVVDLTNPYAPKSSGKYTTSDGVMDVALSGNLAYLAAGAAGLRIVDVANPTTDPIERGKLEQFQFATAISLKGNYAYLTDRDTGVWIVDISRPDNPQVIGNYDTAGRPSDIAAAGNLALIADGANGLRLINVDNLSAPVEISFLETDGFSRGISVDQQFAYLVKQDAGVRVIDLTDRAQPRRASSLDLAGQAEDIVLSNSFGYLTNYDRGLRIITIADPANPKEIGHAQGLNAKRIAVHNDLAYVADPAFGLRIIDVADPFQPSLIQSLKFPNQRAEAIALHENYAYLAAGDDGLIVADVRNPLQPMIAGRLNVAGAAISIDINDHYAYLGTEAHDIIAIDIIDPRQPIQVGALKLISPAYEIVAQHRYLYVANGTSGLRVIDVINPADPKEVGFYVAGSTAYGLAVDQNFIYLSCDETGLFILKFLPLSGNEAPFAPTLVAPPNNHFVNLLNPQLSWHIPRDANNDPLHFKIELDRDGDWGITDVVFESRKNPVGFSPVPPVAAGSGSMNYAIQSPLTEGVWHWRVSAFDGLVYGPYSSAWRFTSDTTAPRISQLSFAQPEYQENWFNPGHTDSATLIVVYDELYPRSCALTGIILPDTLVQTGLLAGINQSIEWRFSIAAQPDGSYPLQVSLEDSAGNVGIALSTIQLDRTPPTGYFSDAPDTIAEGQPYIVRILGANDSLGCGVAQIFLDVFQDTAGAPATPRDFISGPTEPGVYFFRYSAVDYLGNLGSIKTDTTVVTPVYAAVPIFPTTSDQEVLAGDSFWVNVQIGTAEQPVKNLYHVEFVLKISDPQHVSVDSILSGDLFGAPVELSSQIDTLNGQISLNISLPAGESGVAGYGSLVRIKFFADAAVPDQTEIQFSLPVARAMDPNGYPIPLLPSGTTIKILQPLRDFTMTVVPDSQRIFPGDSAQFEVVLSPLGAFDSAVALSLSNVPDGVQPIYPTEPFSIPATKTITFATFETLVPGDYWPIIAASDGSISHSDTVLIRVEPKPIPADFTMIVQPDSQTIFQGDSTDFALTFQPIGEFESPITISVANLPSGMSVRLPEQPFSIPNEVILTFLTVPDILPGSYSPIITASGGEITHRDTVTIIVLEKIVLSDFSMTVVPDSQTIFQGEATEFTVSLQPIGTFADAISLTVSNLPPGMTANYPTQPVAIPAIVAITCSTLPEIAPGTYTPVITAAGGGVVHQDTVTIVVLKKTVLSDFSMTVVPDSQTIYQGESAPFALSFEPIGDFSSPVELHITDLPTGMTVQYPAIPFTIPTSFDITFSTAPDIEPGVYYPTIIATGGGITHQTKVIIRVLERMDFIMIIEPDSQAVTPGEHIEFFISFIPVGGFSAPIVVSVSNVPDGMEARYTSRPFTIPFSITVDFWVPRNFPSGIYYPVVTATGGGITHQQTVVIHVLARQTVQQFSVLPNPFTPNNDGFNDYTEFLIPENISGEISIAIFDISGRKIINIKNSTIWYGRDEHGRELKPGAYIYIVKNDQKIIAKGLIHLAR